MGKHQHSYLLTSKSFIAALERGEYPADLAKKYGTSTSTVWKYRKVLRARGHVILNRPPRSGMKNGLQRDPWSIVNLTGGVKVKCKCPKCENVHIVSFKVKPLVMPRIYCGGCSRYRDMSEAEPYQLTSWRWR
jgi:hypothetical protein